MLEYAPTKSQKSQESQESLEARVGSVSHKRHYPAPFHTPLKSSSVRSGLLQSFRASTQAEHRALEHQPLLRALLTPTLSRAQYDALLQGLFSFYRSLEVTLIPAVRLLRARFPAGDYAYQPRSEWLRQDLLSLGLEPTGGPAPDAPACSGVDAALGVLYVLEGSTQGGRVIAPRIERSLGVTQASGASYFNAHRQCDSWSRFQRWVSDFEKDYLNDGRCDQAVALRSAGATFSGLHTHLNHWQGNVE